MPLPKCFSLNTRGLLLSCLLLAMSIGIGGLLLAQEKPKDEKKDSVEEDYSKELPRFVSLSPADAMKAFHVAPGFKIEQVAAEPLVVDPVAMAFDENGRLFVIEMIDYSEDDKANLGRVRLLEDTDGDGRFDKSTVYVDGLSWPTAVICWKGGIFVGAAPNIYYFKDTNGDGKADEKKLLWTRLLAVECPRDAEFVSVGLGQSHLRCCQ